MTALANDGDDEELSKFYKIKNWSAFRFFFFFSNNLCELVIKAFVRMAYDKSSSILIVELGRASHEMASYLYNSAKTGDSQYWPGEQGDVIKERGGPPYIMSKANLGCELADGNSKEPDFCLVDVSPGIHHILSDFPTVVWEVARAQTSKSLALAAGRWTTASLGRVQLVIAIDIIIGDKPLRGDLAAHVDVADDEKGEEEEEEEDVVWISEVTVRSIQKKGIKEIWCQLWETVEEKELQSIPAGEAVGVVIQDDGEAIGKSFSCIQQHGSLILKCRASAMKTVKVSHFVIRFFSFNFFLFRYSLLNQPLGGPLHPSKYCSATFIGPPLKDPSLKSPSICLTNKF